MACLDHCKIMASSNNPVRSFLGVKRTGMQCISRVCPAQSPETALSQILICSDKWALSSVFYFFLGTQSCAGQKGYCAPSTVFLELCSWGKVYATIVSLLTYSQEGQKRESCNVCNSGSQLDHLWSWLKVRLLEGGSVNITCKLTKQLLIKTRRS